MTLNANKAKLIIGIDALRSKSGGAKAHLVGILSTLHPAEHEIKEIHVWSYQELLDMLPNKPWLIKHTPAEANKSILFQLIWQRFTLPKSLKKNLCDIVLNLDAGTINSFQPSVTMSRDMLSYEKGEMDRYKYSLAWLRLLVIKYVQSYSLKRSTSSVFLTQYASNVIQAFTGPLKNYCFIPHGVGSNFFDVTRDSAHIDLTSRPINCIYVSNIAPYKHQIHVIKAIRKLRLKGYDISLNLVGENKKYSNLISSYISPDDNQWLFFSGHVDQKELPKKIAAADIFIFASSCENMPNTLVEGMAVGMPIVCSNRGPMPEILRDGGLFFDPENHLEILDAIEKIVTNKALRDDMSSKAEKLSKQYSWEKCSKQTFDNIKNTFYELSSKNLD